MGLTLRIPLTHLVLGLREFTDVVDTMSVRLGGDRFGSDLLCTCGNRHLHRRVGVDRPDGALDDAPP